MNLELKPFEYSTTLKYVCNYSTAGKNITVILKGSPSVIEEVKYSLNNYELNVKSS